ncbi:MAG: hypothetical protein RLZZ165_1028 [Bacteroidota bacterium]|jgi:hypothetical protein
MAEKRPTGEEMRRKMKEEFKQDLRKRKEFLDSVQEFKRTKKLSDAVVEIQSAGEDDTDVWVEKLNRDSAMTEAKMEMAMDSSNVSTPDPKKEVAPATEAEMRKIQAAELVRQMKMQMEADNAAKSPATAPEQKTPEPPATPQAPDTPGGLDGRKDGGSDDLPVRKMMEDI